MVKLTEGMVIARTRASDLENVKKLNCWGSELSDVSLLRNMHNVEVLSLSVNKISSLADFQHCQNLQELYIRKNSIKHLDEICYLKDLRKLKNLWLEDNPCAVGDKYRLTVLKMLPQLQKLDNIAVQQEELNDAVLYGLELSHPDERKKSQDSLVSNTTTSSSSASPTHHPETSPHQKRILEDVETTGQVRESAERKEAEWRAAQEEQRRLDAERRAHEDAEHRAQMQKEAEYRQELDRRALQQKEEENLRNREEQMRRNQAQYEPENNTTPSRDTDGQALENSEESVDPGVDEDSSRAGALFGSSNGNFSTTPPNSRIIHPDTNAVYQSRPFLIDASQEFREENANIRGPTTDDVHRPVQTNYPPPVRQPIMERMMSQERPYPVRPKTRNSNILSAVLCLIKELDYASLEVVEMAVRCRMEELED